MFSRSFVGVSNFICGSVDDLTFASSNNTTQSTYDDFLQCFENQVPHFVLYPQQILHSLTPHIFGSTCFIHNLALGLHKLYAQPIELVVVAIHLFYVGT